MEIFASLISFFSSLQLPQWLALALAVILPTALLKQRQVSFADNGAAGSATAFALAHLPVAGSGSSRAFGRGRRQGGFTLIELLICMAILCILGIIVGTVIYFTFFSGRVHISFS
jgi:prepilin-type N-terminal cleavage/methylation domain-containing protein